MAPAFVHVCVNWRTRDHMIYEMWHFLQFYPGAKLLRHNARIVTDGMMHFFVAADFETDRLQGVELKGFSVEYGADVSERQIAFLRSRVRG